MSFAKSLHSLNVKPKAAVAIMGVNSAQWFFSCIGAFLYGCVTTGLYTTNNTDACNYQTEHSDAEIVVVENLSLLAKFDQKLLSKVKAFVVWGETKLSDSIDRSRVFLWDDFIKMGSDIADALIYQNVDKQKPGMCCCLIYTSGTTGMPKGVMLSHDNLVWATVPTCHELQRFKPDLDMSTNRTISYLPLSHIAGL